MSQKTTQVLNRSQEVRRLLNEYRVGLYDFYREDLFTYVLETETKVSPGLLVEIRDLIPPQMVLVHRLTSFQLTLAIPGLA